MPIVGSGELSILDHSGTGRNISLEVDGDSSGQKSLLALGATAGKDGGDGQVSMTEFYNYTGVTPGDIISLDPTDTVQTSSSHTGLSFDVTATGDWTVTKVDTGDWINLVTLSGTGNDTVTFGLDANVGVERYGIIVVTADIGGDFIDFDVAQQAP